MVVIEFEALDEARVEHRRGHRAGSEITPVYQLAGPRGVESRDGLDPLARPGELSTHETAGHAVEHEVLRAITDTLGNVVERHLGNPGSKPAGRSIRVGRRPRTLSLLLGGAVCSGAHHAVPRFQLVHELVDVTRACHDVTSASRARSGSPC